MDGFIAYYGRFNHIRWTEGTAPQPKSISLLSKNIPQTASEKNKDVLMKSYLADKRYLDLPETRKDQK